ncbi:hypothetical protein ACFX2A_036927 [Malus domestica]
MLLSLSAKSLDDLQIRALFKSCEDLRMDPLARAGSVQQGIVDNSHLRFSNLSYLISLRSGFVSLPSWIVMWKTSWTSSSVPSSWACWHEDCPVWMMVRLLTFSGPFVSTSKIVWHFILERI